MALRHLFRDIGFKDSGNEQRQSELLASETLMRINAAFLREHCRQILTDRGLIVANIAYEYFLQINQGKMRKDEITPSEQHEQMHIILADALLKSERNKLGWDTKKYGGEDAFFTAIVFHDVIEDHGHSDTELLRILEDGIEERYKKYKTTIFSHNKNYEEAKRAIDMVRILSRNWPDGDENKVNRMQYMHRLAKLPPTLLIKMIDWANKAATMIGVDHFEKNGQEKIRKNIEETDEVFGDVRQALPKRVAEQHPKLRTKILKLDAIMAILQHILKGYVHRKGQGLDNAGQELPYDFRQWPGLAQSVLRYTPDGGNLIKVLMARLQKEGEFDPVIRTYHNESVFPAIQSLMVETTTPSLTLAFRKAASCIVQRIPSFWSSPKRML
jgi:hypothetical protein